MRSSPARGWRQKRRKTSRTPWRSYPRRMEKQAELAARVQTEGVILEQDAISRIESGSRMVQDYELRALAVVLGMTADGLMESPEEK